MDTSPRRIEAVVRLDVAVDQLLTAVLIAHDADILSPEQLATANRLLDILSGPTLDALRLSAGLDVGSMPSDLERWHS